MRLSADIALPSKPSPSGDLSQRRAGPLSSRSLDQETGGQHGVRDLGGLQSALARPQAVFAETEFYSDVFSKAAVLLDGLTRDHPFLDGNKRISIATAALFLELNGYRVATTDADLEEFTMHVTTMKPGLDQIAEWFRAKTVRIARR